MDFVSPAVIDTSIEDANVHEFIERMALIGEKFVYGPADPVSFLKQCGFRLIERVTAGDYLNDSDPTIKEYGFLIAGREVTWLGEASPRRER